MVWALGAAQASKPTPVKLVALGGTACVRPLAARPAVMSALAPPLAAPAPTAPGGRAPAVGLAAAGMPADSVMAAATAPVARTCLCRTIAKTMFGSPRVCLRLVKAPPDGPAVLAAAPRG